MFSPLNCYKNNDKHNYKKAVMNEFEYEETLKEYRQEGLEEGIQKGWAGGRAEGLEEGRAEGLEEGIQKGSDNRNIEIATRMLKLGYPVEQISLCTDLTEDEILALKP